MPTLAAQARKLADSGIRSALGAGVEMLSDLVAERRDHPERVALFHDRMAELIRARAKREAPQRRKAWQRLQETRARYHDRQAMRWGAKAWAQDAALARAVGCAGGPESSTPDPIDRAVDELLEAAPEAVDRALDGLGLLGPADG